MKKLKMTQEEYDTYLDENEIGEGSINELYGCCVITEIILVLKRDYTNCNSMNMYYESCIVERFDGNKQAIIKDALYLHELKYKLDNRLKGYTIVNLTTNKHGDMTIRDEYSLDKYCPSALAMALYIRYKYWHIGNYREMFSYNIEVGQLHMTKEQMNGLIAKLNIIGKTWMLVELNTIAVCKNENQVTIYTQQRKLEA
jgi:hypothetical protein